MTRLQLLLALPIFVLSITAAGAQPPVEANPILFPAPQAATPSSANPSSATDPPGISSAASMVDPYVQLAQAPGFSADAPLGAATPRPTESILPPGTRSGVFQKVNLRGLWMPRFEDDSVGVSGIDVDASFGFPFPERESPLVITPAYRVRFFEGPNFTDLPSRVHDAEVDFHHFRQISSRWLLDGAVTLGVYGDDHSLGSGDAFRVSGRGLGIYDFCNGWKGVLGVVYLNRAGYSVIPAAGMTYDAGDFKLDLLFPRPRVAWRLPGCARPGYDERWAYVLGEFGGNRWAVRRDSGETDVLAYSDLRLVVGLERKLVGGLSRKWEMGYVFNRDIEFDSVGSDSALDDSLFFRVGMTY